MGGFGTYPPPPTHPRPQLTIPRQVFSLGDIAAYTALGALATLPRAQLKSLVLENTHVRYTMDHGGAPWTRDVVEAFVGARYATVLQLLEAYKVRFFRLRRRMRVLTTNDAVETAIRPPHPRPASRAPRDHPSSRIRTVL